MGKRAEESRLAFIAYSLCTHRALIVYLSFTYRVLIVYLSRTCTFTFKFTTNQPAISLTVEAGNGPCAIAAAKPSTCLTVRAPSRAMLSGDFAHSQASAPCTRVLPPLSRRSRIAFKRPQVSLAGRQTQAIKFAVYARDTTSVLGSTPSAHWVKEQIIGSSYIEVSDPRNALDMAIAGAVKMVLPTFIGDSTEGLQPVSSEIAELEHIQWLVTHHEDRHVSEVRQVIDRVYNLLTT